MPRPKGFKMSEEQKRKIGDSNRGKSRSGGMLGKKHSEESKLKMSLFQSNRTITEEQKNRLRKLNLGRKFGPCKEETKKKIAQANSKLFDKWIAKNGYVVIVVSIYPDHRRMYEHRYVMEQHIGRRLRTDEAVHHIDWDKTNNHIDNLQLMSRKEHARMHANEHIKKGGHNKVFIPLTV